MALIVSLMSMSGFLTSSFLFEILFSFLSRSHHDDYFTSNDDIVIGHVQLLNVKYLKAPITLYYVALIWQLANIMIRSVNQ